MSRLPSTETQLRTARRQLKDLRRQMQPMVDELVARRRIGGALSNIAFNLSQGEKVEASWRQTLTDWRKEWDAIHRAAI